MGFLNTIKDLFTPARKAKKKPAGKSSQASSDSVRTVVAGKSVVKLPEKAEGTGKKRGAKTAAKETKSPKAPQAKPAGRTVAVGKTAVTLPKAGAPAKGKDTSLQGAWKARKEQAAQTQLNRIAQRKQQTQQGLNTEGTSIAAAVNRGIQRINEQNRARAEAQEARQRAQQHRKNQKEMLDSAAQTLAANLKALQTKYERAPETITAADAARYNDTLDRYRAVVGSYKRLTMEENTAAAMERAQKEAEDEIVRRALIQQDSQENNTPFDIDPARVLAGSTATAQAERILAERRKEQLPKTLAGVGLAGIAGAQDALGTAMGLGEQAVWALSPQAQQDTASAADHARQERAWKGEQEQAGKKLEQAFELTEDDALGQFLAELNYNFAQQGAAMVAGGVIGKAGGTVLKAAGNAAGAAGANMAGKLGSQAAQRAAAAAGLSGRTLQGAARYLQKNAGIGTMATLAGSKNYQEAVEGGADNEQAMAYAVLTAAAEAVTEKLFGGNPLMDNEAGWVNRALYKMLGDRKFLKALESVPVDVFNEGLEEVIANYLYSGARAVTGQDAALPTAQENLHSFALGAAMGGIGQAVKLGGTAIQDRETGRTMQEMGAGQELLATGMALPGSRTEQLARELSGRKSLPTARELGRQYRENVMAQQLLTVKEEKALRSAQEMARQTGAQVVIDRSLRKDANGYYQNGVIHLSEDMEKATITVFKHELTHHLQQTAPEEYQAFRAAAVELAGEQSVQQLQEQYARHGVQLTDEEALDEVAANFTEKLLTDSESIRQLIDTKPTLADRFFAALRELLQRLTGRVDPKLKQAEKLWTEAYQAARGNKNTATEGGAGKYSFAGKKAGGADLEKLNRAIEMQKGGADTETIRRETGWFTGADGKWRFEVDDSGMEFRQDGDAALMREEGYQRLQELTDKWAKSAERGQELPQEESAEMERLQDEYSDRVWEEKYLLRDFLHHDKLFQAYPQLNLVNLAFENLPNGVKGTFRKTDNTIILNKDLFGKALDDTLIHEIQHAIQKIEGFSEGSSPNYWAALDAETGAVKSRLRQERINAFRALSKEEQNKYTRYQELMRVQEELEDAKDGTPEAERYIRYERESDQLYLELWEKPWFKHLVDLDRKLQGDNGEEYLRLYRNTAGEIEARDAANRRTMTQEQRRETKPDTGDKNTVFAEGAERSYEINEQFRTEIQKWDRAGQPKSEVFILGSTGPTLQGLGAIESDIYMNGDKISTIFKQHPEMSIREIQRIPEVLEDPVLILKSKGKSGKQNNSRIVLYGTMKAQNGQPVLAVLDLRPQENGFMLADMQKVNSSYTKKNPISFIQNSDVLYADKKRATQLLRKFGLTIASRQLLLNGSIGSIVYEGNNVKLTGVPFTSVVKPGANSQKKFSLKEDGGELKHLREEMLGRFSVQRGAERKEVEHQIDQVLEKIRRTGAVTANDEAELFRSLYQAGTAEDLTAQNDYAEIRTELKGVKLHVDPDIRAELGDNWEDVRRQARSNGIILTLKDGKGIGIDVEYAALADRYPGMFQADATDRAEMLEEMISAAGEGKAKRISLMESAMQEGGEDAVAQQMMELDRYLMDELSGFAVKARVARELQERSATQESAKAQASRPNQPTLKTYAGEEIEKRLNEGNRAMQDLKAAWEMKRRTEQKAEELKERLALSSGDAELAQTAARRGLGSVNWETAADQPAEARRYAAVLMEVETATKPISMYFAQRAEAMQAEAAEAAKALAEGATDKRSGFAYQRETMERNIRDIFGKKHEKAANQIIRTYIAPVHDAVAEGNRLKNEYRRRVKALHLSKHESALVQMMLEKESMAASEYAENHHIRITPERQKKLAHAVAEFRAIYNELYDQINNALLRNGQEPAPFRKDYAPHFVLDRPDTILGKLRFMLGLGKDSSLELPTDIAGITDQFRPGKKWFGNLLQRKGEITDYDAVHGFDQYVETAADVITLTDSIQKLRALEDEVRYTFSDEGIQKEIDAIRKDSALNPLQKRQKMEDLYGRDDQSDQEKATDLVFGDRKRTGMANFVVELRRYTDNLAGKKSREDRGLEDLLNRQVYHIAKKLEGRVAANMIALNPGSWLTNVIPITQATGEVSKANLLRGMRDTVRAMTKDDGFKDASVFLTNRYGSDRIDKTLTESLSGIAGAPMEIIDRFTANVITRARYHQNIQAGKDGAAALDDADGFAARLMADRSKGALPTIFNAKNPAWKVFTMFQVEVNNQLSYLFKDLPKAKAEKGAAAIALAYTNVFVGAYLYNLLYKELTGRDAALDPIGIIAEALGIGDDEDEKPTAKESAEIIAGGIVKNLPFAGGVLGGGRVPISAALPNVQTIWNSATSDAALEKKKQTVGKELTKPLVYLVPPFGGGAAKKAIEGAATVREGGSYTYDKDGNRRLQFPVYDQEPLNYAQAMIFGKWSSKAAQEYVDNGFRGLSVPETEAFDTLRKKLGVDGREAMETLLSLRELEPDQDENGDTIQGSLCRKKTELIEETKWKDEAKAALYFNDGDCAGETVLENRDALKKQGVGQDKYYRYLAGTMNIKAEKDEDGETIDGSVARQKAEWLEKSGWNNTEKAAVYFADAASESCTERRDSLQKEGVDQETYYRYLSQTAGVEPDYTPEGNAVNGSKNKKLYQVLDAMDLTAEQKAALYVTEIDDVTEDKQYDAARDAGVGLWDYAQFKANTGAMVSDKGKDGKSISGSKKKKVLDYINAMKITREAKDALYYAAGYKESTISDAPWRGGSVKVGKASSAKSTGKGKGKTGSSHAAASSPAVQKFLSRGGYATAPLPKAGEPARSGTLPKAGEMDAVQKFLSRGGYR